MEEKEKKNALKGFLKKEVLISLVVGLLIGAGIMFFVNGGFAAKIGGKFITSKSLYNVMTKRNTIDLLLNEIDSKILNKKYELTEDEIKELEETAKSELEGFMAYYGYGTEEEVLKASGYKDLEELLKYFELDYKRSLFYYDYLETQLDENAVKTKYDEDAFGKVNNKHILVKTSENMTKEQALKVANDIIGRLNSGEEFDKLGAEYLEKNPENIIQEDLGEIGAFDNIEKSYLEALKGLEKGKYTTAPVETSYGYHVIYCVDRTEKTEEISRDNKMAIINELAVDIMSKEPNLYQKTLIKMREDANVKIFNKTLKQKYEDYLADYLDDGETEVDSE